MKRLLKINHLAYFYLLFLFLGTVLPINSGSSALNDHYTLHIRWDYLLHALVYMPLPVLLGLTFRKKSKEQLAHPFSKSRFWIQVVLISLFVTALFELLQMILPYRAFNINDLLANGVGAIMGLVVAIAFRERWLGLFIGPQHVQLTI